MENLEVCILNQEFATVALVDAYESFIWTDRYKEAGDFELYLPASEDALVYAIHGYYVWIAQSEKLMIIEATEITTDIENGNHLKITGRSLESILHRRIVWNKITLSGKVQNVIKTLITDAFINPSMSTRRIDDFIFIETDDGYIDSCEIEETQLLGEDIYEVIVEMLAPFGIGFKVIYNFDTENFEMSLYYGKDRSYNQDILPWVVFSPEFDNIVSSDFIETSENYKNVNLIAGEERENKTRKFVYVGDESGLYRREMFTDGSSNQQEYTDENDRKVTLTDEQYIAVLRTKALEEITKEENSIVKTFDGEMNNVRSFYYGSDFDLGDVVQMYNEYGLGAPARVTEMIMSQSTDEIKMYPTFEAI